MFATALRPPSLARARALALVGVAVTAALASLLVPSAPGYDPWAWLVWGRELIAFDLSTAEGPAWKPLPVLVTAPLAAMVGELAPEGWLVVARAGAIVAVLLAFGLARRVSGGSIAAGMAAAVALLLVPGWVENAAVGNAEGLLVALLLGALACALDGRLRAAFVLGVAAALLRVEVWPFLLVLGVAFGRRDPRARAAICLAGVGVGALWFVPELLGSGELLRSADRARTPNPGAPALAAQPAVATLVTAARLVPLIVLVGLAALLVGLMTGRVRVRGSARDALGLAAVGVVWIALVAAMSELGFSGEARYLLPGVAVVTVAGVAAPVALCSWRAARGVMAVIVALALAASGVARWDGLRAEADRVAYGAALADDLERAVARAGGASAVQRCGPAYVGPYRGPMLAWALGVHKDEVEFAPSRPGVSFRSRLRPGGPVAPASPPARQPATGGSVEPAEYTAALAQSSSGLKRPPVEPDLQVREGGWEIVGACRGGRMP